MLMFEKDENSCHATKNIARPLPPSPRTGAGREEGAGLSSRQLMRNSTIYLMLSILAFVVAGYGLIEEAPLLLTATLAFFGGMSTSRSYRTAQKAEKKRTKKETKS
jgi:hypothetical protein